MTLKSTIIDVSKDRSKQQKLAKEIPKLINMTSV
jgi:hypothetical protein